MSQWAKVLGLLLFVLYTADLELITCRHDIEAHFFANDDDNNYVKFIVYKMAFTVKDKIA